MNEIAMSAEQWGVGWIQIEFAIPVSPGYHERGWTDEEIDAADDVMDRVRRVQAKVSWEMVDALRAAVREQGFMMLNSTVDAIGDAADLLESLLPPRTP